MKAFALCVSGMACSVSSLNRPDERLLGRSSVQSFCNYSQSSARIRPAKKARFVKAKPVFAKIVVARSLDLATGSTAGLTLHHWQTLA